MNGMLLNRKRLLPYIIFYTLVYYLWIYTFRNEAEIQLMGANVFSTVSPMIAAAFLFYSYKRSIARERFFWLFMALGCFWYFVAEMVWNCYEFIFKVPVPFPSWADLFYMLQIGCFMVALISKVIEQREGIRLVRFVLDVAIVMTVAVTLSWHFIIGDMLSQKSDSLLYLVVTLGYPIGDLGLLCGVVVIYLSSKNILPQNVFRLLVGGLMIQIIADTAYLYLNAKGIYNSGGYLDPIWSFALLLVGVSAFYQISDKKNDENSNNNNLDLSRMLLPYVGVVILFVIMVTRNGALDIISIGSGISIILVIGRQVYTLIDNEFLLNRYHHLNELLEAKVNQRTKELTISEQKYKSLFDFHPDAVFSLDLSGNFISMNQSGFNMFGRVEDELYHESFLEIFSEDESDGIDLYLRKAKQGFSSNFDTYFSNQDGLLTYINLTFIPMNANEKVVGVHAICKDITAQKKNQDKINYMAYHDALTGLPNRRLFEEKLKREMRESLNDETKLAVMFLDLDRFKVINDTLGHEVGDKLLVSVANRLQQVLGEGHFVARQGGDEFTLIVKNDDHVNSFSELAGLILKKLGAPYIIDGNEIRTTPSIGISVYPDHGKDSVALMKYADMAMYRAKEQGKNDFRLYSDDLNEQANKKWALEKEMRAGIDHEEFILHYQPLIDTRKQTVVGMEALVRWKHPILGIIPPAEFIPIAEETGLIVELGEWVIRRVCKDLARWGQKNETIKVGINLSAKQFFDEKLISNIQSVLTETGINPSLLDFEITEGIAMQDTGYFIEKLKKLKSLNVTVSVDDFGTGYSSLSYLSSFPIDTLKIAGVFVENLESNTNNKSIISSIVSLAENLNLKVIAEGVETEEQVQILKSLGCHKMQGYYYSKPLPLEEIMNYYDERNYVIVN